MLYSKESKGRQKRAACLAWASGFWARAHSAAEWQRGRRDELEDLPSRRLDLSLTRTPGEEISRWKMNSTQAQCGAMEGIGRVANSHGRPGSWLLALLSLIGLQTLVGL